MTAVAMSLPESRVAPRPFSEMPLVPGTLIGGNLKEFRDDPVSLFLRASDQHGPLVRFRIGPQSFVLVTCPESAHKILVDNQKFYDKTTRGYQKLKILLGNGLLTSNGSFWLRQRRIAQPAFHRDKIQSFADTMTQSTTDMLDRWDEIAASGASLDVGHEMMKLTLRIVGLTLLSTDVEGDSEIVGESLTVALKRTDELITELTPFAEHWPTKRNRAFHSAKDVLDSVVKKIIAERRTGEEKNDLLSMLMRAEDDETKERMTDAQLKDEIMTMFLAGHETTANALSWALHLLDENPEVADRVAAEVNAVAGDDTFGMSHLKDAPFLSAVVDETLRLYPPAWMIARNSTEDQVLGDYLVPKGTYHLISIFGLHRTSRIWKDPLSFRPERFLDGNKEAPPGGYIPFIEGPRMCIGKSFALMEAKLLLAHIVRRHRLTKTAPVDYEAAITLRPANGLHMRLSPR